MRNKKNNYQLLVKGNIYKRICLLSVPTIISMLITAVYNAADTYFVSSFGESAIAGVSVVMSYLAIVQAFGFFFGHGSGNFISKALGAKDKPLAVCVHILCLHAFSSFWRKRWVPTPLVAVCDLTV